MLKGKLINEYKRRNESESGSTPYEKDSVMKIEKGHWKIINCNYCQETWSLEKRLLSFKKI